MFPLKTSPPPRKHSPFTGPKGDLQNQKGKSTNRPLEHMSPLPNPPFLAGHREKHKIWRASLQQYMEVSPGAVRVGSPFWPGLATKGRVWEYLESLPDPSHKMGP